MNSKKRLFILISILVVFCVILYTSLSKKPSIETTEPIIESTETIKPVETTSNKPTTTEASKTSNSTTNTSISSSFSQQTTESIKTNSPKPAFTQEMTTTQSTESKPSKVDTEVTTSTKEEITSTKNADLFVTLRVIGPNDIIILDSTTVPITEGDSVYTVLEKTLKEKGIPLTTTGSKNNIYVSGIDKYFEFDFGPNSGFVYTVDNNSPSYSSSKYLLKGYENVTWRYKH